MEKTLFLFAIIIFCGCNRMKYEERLERKGEIKCGWYGKMKPQERLKVFPFNQANKILLISFPDYEIDEYTVIRKTIFGDSVITPWGEKLPPIDIDYVYEKPKTKITRPILDTFKLFDRVYSVYEIVKLNQSQIDSLSNLVFNYKLNRKTRYTTITESCCYKPRNAIIFLDKNGEPILNYEICFECSRNKVYPLKSNI